jgi:hypothetical protein
MLWCKMGALRWISKSIYIVLKSCLTLHKQKLQRNSVTIPMYLIGWFTKMVISLRDTTQQTCLVIKGAANGKKCLSTSTNRFLSSNSSLVGRYPMIQIFDLVIFERRKIYIKNSVVDPHWFQCGSRSSFCLSQSGSRSGFGSREQN